MKLLHVRILVFALAAVCYVGWFLALAVGRTSALTSSTGPTSVATTALFLIMAASLGWVGELVLDRLLPAYRLRKRGRLIATRLRKRTKEVTVAQERIRVIDAGTRDYDDTATKIGAAHTIHHDHALPRTEE